jgi:hypothetical protein
MECISIIRRITGRVIGSLIGSIRCRCIAGSNVSIRSCRREKE